MNVIISIQDFMIENTFFLETKKNILMDGNFTKIIYSDELVTLNGIYLLFPILNYNTNRVTNKKYIYFQINNNDNLQIIKELMTIRTKFYIITRRILAALNSQIIFYRSNCEQETLKYIKMHP
jgi:hypothetical protein